MQPERVSVYQVWYVFDQQDKLELAVQRQRHGKSGIPPVHLDCGEVQAAVSHPHILVAVRVHLQWHR